MFKVLATQDGHVLIQAENNPNAPIVGIRYQIILQDLMDEKTANEIMSKTDDVALRTKTAGEFLKNAIQEEKNLTAFWLLNLISKKMFKQYKRK